MADDARISTALPKHPKIVKVRRRLGTDGCWHYVCLLLWVAENRSDGNLCGMTDEDIEIAADWSGAAGQFVSTLSEVRLLDGDAGSRLVHDWAEHNPWAASRPKRIAAARAAAAKRWEHKQNADGMRVACATHETAMPTSPLHTTPHPTSPPESKADARRASSRQFTPPSIEEVRGYCRERGNLVDPERWYDFYVSNGWRVGRNPMRDWRATIRRWEKSSHGPNGKSEGHREKQPTRQVERFNHNLAEFHRTFGPEVGEAASPDGSRPAPRVGARDARLLEGKIV